MSRCVHRSLRRAPRTARPGPLADVHSRCCYHEDVRKAAAPLLEAAGWGSADAARRAELALAFTDDVINAFEGRFLRQPPGDWPAAKKPFVAPAATPADGGALTVRGWMRDHPA